MKHNTTRNYKRINKKPKPGLFGHSEN